MCGFNNDLLVSLNTSCTMWGLSLNTSCTMCGFNSTSSSSSDWTISGGESGRLRVRLFLAPLLGLQMNNNNNKIWVSRSTRMKRKSRAKWWRETNLVLGSTNCSHGRRRSSQLSRCRFPEDRCRVDVGRTCRKLCVCCIPRVILLLLLLLLLRRELACSECCFLDAESVKSRVLPTRGGQGGIPPYQTLSPPEFLLFLYRFWQFLWNPPPTCGDPVENPEIITAVIFVALPYNIDEYLNIFVASQNLK